MKQAAGQNLQIAGEINKMPLSKSKAKTSSCSEHCIYKVTSAVHSIAFVANIIGKFVHMYSYIWEVSISSKGEKEVKFDCLFT